MTKISTSTLTTTILNPEEHGMAAVHQEKRKSKLAAVEPASCSGANGALTTTTNSPVTFKTECLRGGPDMSLNAYLKNA
ncbi:MAG: hypothetical protein ABI298_06670, partial [Acidimicrobiales bacterium]